MTTIAIPNRRFPPAEEAVGRTALVIDSLEQLGAERLDRLTLSNSSSCASRSSIRASSS